MTEPASAGQDPAVNPAPGAPESTPSASPAATAGPSPTPSATPASAALPAQMPSLDDPSAWEGMPKWLRDLRQENATRRTNERALSDKVTALEREKLTESERVVADLNQAVNETIPSLNQTIQRLQVQVAAGAKGVVDPEAAAALLDWESVKAGTSIDAALDALVAKKPWLVAPQAQAQPAATTAQPATTSPAAPASTAERIYTEAEIARMGEAEYEANQADILAAMAEGRVRK